jgi:hypothetical protein
VCALQKGVPVEVGWGDVAVGLSDEVTPDVAVGAVVVGGDGHGPAKVGVLFGRSVRVVTFISIEGGEVGWSDVIERAPDVFAGGGEDIGDTALPFFVRQGEGEAVMRESGWSEESVPGTESLHLRGAEVGAVGEVEDVHTREED